MRAEGLRDEESVLRTQRLTKKRPQLCRREREREKKKSEKDRIGHYCGIG